MIVAYPSRGRGTTIFSTDEVMLASILTSEALSTGDIGNVLRVIPGPPPAYPVESRPITPPA